jgi:3-methyladenine DNA glycosylase Tag
MEAIILTKEQFQELNSKLEGLTKQLETQTQNPSERFVDNQEFMKLMNISKRTSQVWRDEGKITFSQIGLKIYYKLSDIEAFLNQHSRKSFIDNKSFRYK